MQEPAIEKFKNKFAVVGSETNCFFFPLYIWNRAACQERVKEILGTNLKNYFFLFEKDGWQQYWIEEELKKFANYCIERILEDKNYIGEIEAKVKKANDKLVEVSDKILQTNLEQKTEKELFELFEKYYNALYEVFASGSVLAVCIDLQHLTLTNKLKNWLMPLLEKQSKIQKFAEYFSILTTPIEKIATQKEKEELLQLKKKMQTENIEKALEKHAKKYAWIGFKYNGPAWTLQNFKERLEQLEEKPKEEKGIHEKQKEIEETTGMPANLSKLFSAARTIMWIKNHGKESRYYSYFCVEKLIEEISKRTSYSAKEIKFLTKEETAELLLNKKRFDELLKERTKSTLHLFIENKEFLITGEKANEIVKQLKEKEEKIDYEKPLTGMPASPGIAEGTARIINSTADISKMQKGDILIAHQTNPDLAIAMEKAAAIVTEVGGLTCHAAIVARELRKPAIVGVDNLLKAIKDGDYIKVDAEKGIIRILK